MALMYSTSGLLRDIYVLESLINKLTTSLIGRVAWHYCIPLVGY